jgi:CDP-glucose 4,6-dehydratase
VELRGCTLDPAVVSSFWQGRRVLVTGHSGFKGSWLCLWLASMGAEPIGLSNGLPSDPALFELAGLDSQVRSVTGDVRDRDAVVELVERERAEVVFHMAAQSLVRRSQASPALTYEVNTMGTVNVLEAVRRSDDVRVFVNVTSDKCYENREWVWGYREHEPLGGRDPYSSSKACGELVTAAYRATFTEAGSPAIASARAGNVIGGGDFAEDRLVPDLMRGAIEGRAVPIRSLHAVRPWQHVLSPLSGYLTLAERAWDEPSLAGPWNFGPREDDARTVRHVVERVAELWGDELRWENASEPEGREARHLKLDSSKARAMLGWAPRWDLDRALEETVDWYRAYVAGEPLQPLMLRQLKEYSAVPLVDA